MAAAAEEATSADDELPLDANEVPLSARKQFMEEKVSIDEDAIFQAQKEAIRQAKQARQEPLKAAAFGVATKAATAASLPDSVPKVAFLFIAMDRLAHEQIWDKFFEGAPSSNYSIYLHRGAVRGHRASRRGVGSAVRWMATQVGLHSSKAGDNFPLARWGAVDVDRVENAWCALFGVQAQLLALSLADPSNEQFIFVSDSTVPLKGFSYIYRELAVRSPDTSKICFAERAKYKRTTTEVTKNEVAWLCYYRDFFSRVNPRTPKHHQWVVLAREHAQTVLDKAWDALTLWKASWEKSAEDSIQGDGCSDESVPATALLQDWEKSGNGRGNVSEDLLNMGVESKCLTFVHWRHCFKGTEFDTSVGVFKELHMAGKHFKPAMLFDKEYHFCKTPLCETLNGFPTVFRVINEDYLRHLAGEGFMFARKFDTDVHVQKSDGVTVIPLSQALPELWGQVDEHRAAARVWSLLSRIGAPVGGAPRCDPRAISVTLFSLAMMGLALVA